MTKENAVEKYWSKKLTDYTENLSATMLATTLGLKFDSNRAWDQRKQQYKMSG